MKPLVSIGVPTYNRKKYLISALTSVINQNYPNIELVISDNHSNDDTEDVVLKFISENSNFNIKYYRLDENLGAYKNWMNCINHANGEYFLMLSDDDILEKDSISNLVNAMKNDTVLVIGEKYIIDQDGNILNSLNNHENDIYVYYDYFGKRFFDIKNLSGEYDSYQFWKERLEGRMHDTPSAVLYRTSLGKKFFPNIENAGTAIDLALDLILSEYGKIVTIPQKVVRYRIHNGNDSNNTFRCALSHFSLYLLFSNNFDKDKLSFLQKYCFNAIFGFAAKSFKYKNYRQMFTCIFLLFKRPLCSSKLSSLFLFLNLVIISSFKVILKKMHLCVQ